MPFCAHQARLARTASPTLALVLVLVSPIVTMSQPPTTESDALLTFKATLANSSILTNWDPAKRPCDGETSNWIGVICYRDTVWGIQLESKGLTGQLNVDALVAIRYLRSLSFMNNKFEGPFPTFKKLRGLRSLYLSNNWFSGEIPDDAFEGMDNLKKVLLANNAFQGKIPSSLAALPRLLELRLNGNQFGGQIPDFKNDYLRLASFENNDLEGPIPASLSRKNPGSFAGNKGLCGAPLAPCSPEDSSPHPDSLIPSKNNNGSMFTAAIVLIVIGIILVLLALAVCILLLKRRRPRSDSASVRWEETREFPTRQSNAKKAPDQPKLFFLHGDTQKFDLHDLLKASAEVLGSGAFGASYKAVITGGRTLVVKRYKQMNNAGRDEFHEHMRRLGNLNHPNLLPLVAYYYRREESLMITEYMPKGSLASHLHTNHSIEQPGLDWPTRLKIVKGVAKALSYLYVELPTLVIPHGHLKSTNVLLDNSFEPLVSDYALRPVMNSEHAHSLMIAYKSPEYSKKGSITKKTDVWCLGILILELLTGKFPENYLTQGFDSNMSLVTWVSEMVKEKKTGEVFDNEMTGKKDCKGDMINLMKIGLSCCEEDEERRLDMKEAVEKIEQLKEGEFDEEFASNSSDGNSYGL